MKDKSKRPYRIDRFASVMRRTKRRKRKQRPVEEEEELEEAIESETTKERIMPRRAQNHGARDSNQERIEKGCEANVVSLRSLNGRHLNRCRSPAAFSHLAKSEKECCAHCHRVLAEEYNRENPNHTLLWVCSFCRTHWFKRKGVKCYKWCDACRSFHRAV